MQQSAAQLGIEAKRISEAALAWLGNFAFPGNVRQLENICHWLSVMAPAQSIEPKDLPPEIGVVTHASCVPDEMTTLCSVQGDVAECSEAASDACVASMSELSVTDGRTQVLVPNWEHGLQAHAHALLSTDHRDVWDDLTRRFESSLILAALTVTHGRRIEAAQKLGIGRNTITRKIQELGLESPA